MDLTMSLINSMDKYFLECPRDLNDIIKIA